VRKHRPDCLINSRIIHRGRGVQVEENLPLFDYSSIADKEVPTKKLPLYVESPDSVSSSFGYKTKGSYYYHSVEEMIHRFVNTVCAGGNALINNGPMGNGPTENPSTEPSAILSPKNQKVVTSPSAKTVNPSTSTSSAGKLEHST